MWWGFTVSINKATAFKLQGMEANGDFLPMQMYMPAENTYASCNCFESGVVQIPGNDEDRNILSVTNKKTHYGS